MKTTAHAAIFAIVLATATWVQAAPPFDPAGRAAAIAPYIDELTVAVAHVDISRVEVGPLVDQAVKLVPVTPQGEREAREVLPVLKERFRKAGVTDVYAVWTLADSPIAEPFFILPLGEQGNVDVLLDKLRPGDTEAGRAEVKRLGNVVFERHSHRDKTLSRLEAMKPTHRPELTAGFEAAGDTAAQLVLLPPVDSRRIVEQMMPSLPQEIGGGPSTVLTRGFLWAVVGVKAPPELSLHLVVQSEDEAAAVAFRGWLVTCARLLAEKVKAVDPDRDYDKVLAMLNPKLQGDRLTLAFSTEDGTMAALLAALTLPVDAYRVATQRSESVNNLKKIILAMHNYYDVHKSLPAEAKCDAEGKPLLSWRVLVLPYLDHKALYDQFHLDEPWDSQHNRKLIAQMPDVYLSPASKQKKKDGHSNYVVPVGPGAIFTGGPQGIKFSDVTDGTSNTIMVVEVNDERSVVWTKPEDLALDLADPAKGLGGLYEGGFNAGWCDGSIQFVPLPFDAKTLRYYFIRNDGHVVSRP